MSKGYLIVTVYVNNIAEPISDATVIVTGDNYNETFITDINGKTIPIELEAPDKIYSLTPKKNVRPYSIYTVEVYIEGYETTIIKGVQIFPEETSLQNVYLSYNNQPMIQAKTFMASVDLNANIVDIPPHSLWEEEQKIDQSNNVILNDDTRVYPMVLIPEYVIVHNGIPSNTNAANYYVPFIDYIKNVASSEIYSTWPKEAIKANINAIVSFTLNRIFTEWYKSQGYSFTITASPKYDQTYVHNRTIFKTISDITDEIFYEYIQLFNTNHPFLAQYNDGIDVNNTGWLSQWGAKSLADQGYDALRILRYFYTNNLTLEQSDEIQGLPLSFPGYNLTEGMCNEAIQKVQIMLNTISGSYPAIPKAVPANGEFKESTVNSVRKFQEVFNLPRTGTIDLATWYRISYIYVAVSKMLQGL